MDATATLIRGATIISVDPDVGDLTGDLLIRGTKIAAVAPHIEVGADVEVIDASGHIAIPGFIDSHRHLHQALTRGLASDWSLMQYCVVMFGTIGEHFTPDDMYLANRLGPLDALDSGVTALFDWSNNQQSPDHTNELIRAP